MHVFGCELWNVAKEKRAFRALGVAYHSCIKKLLRVPRWARNHELCDDVNMLPFHMLVACRQLCFWKGLCGSGNRLVSASFVMGEHGLIGANHRHLRGQYGLWQLDLASAGKADVHNVFRGLLSRIVAERRREADPD